MQSLIDPLLNARKSFAEYSLIRSYQRINKQKEILQKYDETQIDQMYDQLVYSSLGFQNICTEFGDSSSVTKGRFSSCGRYYVTIGASGAGYIWNTQNQQQNSFARQITELKGVDKLCDVDIHPSIGYIPTFAPNILTATTFGQILVWTFDRALPAQKCIKIKAHSDRISNIRFHQSGRYFFTASYDKSWGIWDSARIKQLSNQKGHNKQIHSFNIHPDGSLVLTGDLGGDGMVWDIRTGRGVYQFNSNSSIVCSAFHPNGFQFVVGGKNNLINVFDLRRKKQLRAIPAHLKLVSDLTYTKSGSLLLSSGHDNLVKFWHGRSYCSVGSQLEHNGKISSISCWEDERLGVTLLDRKWTIWSRKNKVKKEGLKVEEIEKQ